MDRGLVLKLLCAKVFENPESCTDVMREIEQLIGQVPEFLLPAVIPLVLSVSVPIFKNLSSNVNCYKEKDKLQFVSTFRTVFQRTKIDKVGIFYNFYSFLLFELYDPVQNKNKNISEEYKLNIVQCIIALLKSLSRDIVMTVYKKNNTARFCEMLYVLLEMAKLERHRLLRISTMECIMCLARVHDEEDTSDLELQKNISDVFIFFLPGIASGMSKIILEEETCGQKVTAMAIKTFGRVTSLVTRDYGLVDQQDDRRSKFTINVNTNKAEQKPRKWKNNAEILQLLDLSQRDEEWYGETDGKLKTIIAKHARVVQHSSTDVRLEFATTCSLFVTNCLHTVPLCVCESVHHLVALSEDEEDEIARFACSALHNLSDSYNSSYYIPLMQNLEEKFYTVTQTLPRIFNRRDRNEQLMSLKLVIGYLNMFSSHRLEHVLNSSTYLNQLLFTLIHIAELEKTEIRLLEEYMVADLEDKVHQTPWKRFVYFINDEVVQFKLENLCKLFCKYGVLDIVTDFLLDVFLTDSEHKCEATWLLNELFIENQLNEENIHCVKNIINTYLDPIHWNLTLSAEDAPLNTVRQNIIQSCLQTEGLGKLAIILKSEFEQFLLKSLYLVLEKAGSSHPVMRLAGLRALNNIMKACGYNNVTELININSDYFSYHVVRKLNRSEYSENVLNVLAVALKYSTKDVLLSVANIVEVVLMQSCDKLKEQYANSYLRVFKIFIKCLWRWFNIEVKFIPIKSKLQKQKDFEEFKVSNIDYSNDFSDNIMGKTAEEMFKEDMESNKEEFDDYDEVNDEYNKPGPPLHIRITVSILKRSLNFIPSKNEERKLLALEILRDGLEVIRDWEDELLPIVHLIWGPLVNRFRESEKLVIVNISFQLLTTLARMSQDFIRSRTEKEALPTITKFLLNQANESLLKDKGSSYRYSQSYKLQLTIISNLGHVLAYIEANDNSIQLAMDSVAPYLSIKQPIPLQEASIDFFYTLANYDSEPVKRKLSSLQDGSHQFDLMKNALHVINKIQDVQLCN